jgi:hypothetical protein
MQRGGVSQAANVACLDSSGQSVLLTARGFSYCVTQSWDNTDIRGAKRKEQSVSIFGVGQGLDWTGTRSRTGPSETMPGAAPKFGSNYKAPNVKDMKGLPKDIKSAGAEQPKKKGLFGMF